MSEDKKNNTDNDNVIEKEENTNHKIRKAFLIGAIILIAVSLGISAYISYTNYFKEVEYDLTQMDPDEAYNIMSDLYSLSESEPGAKNQYQGKSFIIKGVVGRTTVDVNGQKYQAVRINQIEKNSNGKSASGPLIKLIGKTLSSPKDPSDEYPKAGTIIQVRGKFMPDDSYISDSSVTCNVLKIEDANYEVIQESKDVKKA